MKGGLAAQLTVLRRFKEENASFDADIEFVGLSDEERHSIGAHAYVKLMQQQNALRKKNFFLMGEPHFDNIVIGATGKALLSLLHSRKRGPCIHAGNRYQCDRLHGSLSYGGSRKIYAIICQWCVCFLLLSEN